MAQDSNKECGTCFFWTRVAHPLDFELGRCALLELEMGEHRVCNMWESKLSSATDAPPSNEAAE